MAEPFIAEIRIWSCNFAPRGFAFCDGQLLPIAQNTALFSLIGTTYGGDGRTTTGLPNLQGRVPMHPGRGPGLTSRRLGQRGGSESAGLALSQIPNHTHAFSVALEDGDSTQPANNYLSLDGQDLIYAEDSNPLNGMNSEMIQYSGGNQPHNNMQPFLTLNFCIALVGLFPSRS